MLNEFLNLMSEHLLQARMIRPIAPADTRPGRWCERACHAELKQPLPAAVAGDGRSLENARGALLRHLTALVSADFGGNSAAAIAQDVHALLNAASWCDVSGSDPYRYDPCGIDFAFAETACALAATLNVLRQPLAAISPALPQRIEQELNRRMLKPLARAEALDGIPLQECCLLLIAAILGGSDESLRWAAISRLCRAIDQKLNQLPKDGSVPGGVEFAVDTAVLLMDMAEVIRIATKRQADMTRHERLTCMADYPLFAHLQSGWFVNPGEHEMQAVPDAEGLFRFGQRTSDGTLCDTAAWLLRNGRACASAQLITRLLNRNTARALEESPGRIRLFRDGFLPDAGVMFMRGFHLHISMTGATGTSHADAGNICLFHREQPILVDIGPGACDTALHSLPTVGGIGQIAPAGPECAECGSGDASSNTTCYTVNLTAAYPPQCHISDYQRTLLMGSAKACGVRLMEMLELTEPAPVDFHFICACEPVPDSRGMRIGPVLLRWDGKNKPLTHSIEKLPYQNLYRLTLHSDAETEQQHIFEFVSEP